MESIRKRVSWKQLGPIWLILTTLYLNIQDHKWFDHLLPGKI